METDDNELLSLQKAISGHEQAEAALTDLKSCLPADIYASMQARIAQNLVDLHAEAARLQGERAKQGE